MSMHDPTSSPAPLHKASPGRDYANNHAKSLPPSPGHSNATRRSGSSDARASRSPRERHHVPSAKELMRMLVDEQETTRDLQEQLTLNTSQLVLEQDRADVAERKLRETVVRFKDANDARMSAQADAAKLREELKLYKTALEEAQKEIFKAQNILREVEGRRREAEEEATQLRRKVRKMNEEKMVEMAREEGRKQGLQEGLEMGKDIGYLRGRNQGYVNGRSTADRVMERYFSPPSEAEARRLRGEADLPPESEAPYAATTTRFPPSASSSSSSSEGGSRGYGRNGGMRSGSVRTTLYSPALAQGEIPPDGFIPEADASMIIRLPPPHELVRPPVTPGTQSVTSTPGSPQIPPVPVPGDVPVLMIPEPRSPVDAPGERQHRRVRRRTSRESVSSSTRTSELDLLNAPEYHGHRGSGLSAIAEVASLQEKGTPLMKQQEEDRVDEAGFVHVSMPAPVRAGSVKSRASLLSAGHARPGSTSSCGTVNITVQPPSRPASDASATTTTRPHLLSPADADRPIPLPGQPGVGDEIVMDLPSGELPPGFVPSGPPTGYTGAGVPLPPSTVGTYHSRMLSQEGAVIPPPSGGSVEDTDSSSDADTLTTPPGRYRGVYSYRG